MRRFKKRGRAGLTLSVESLTDSSSDPIIAQKVFVKSYKKRARRVPGARSLLRGKGTTRFDSLPQE